MPKFKQSLPGRGSGMGLKHRDAENWRRKEEERQRRRDAKRLKEKDRAISPRS